MIKTAGKRTIQLCATALFSACLLLTAACNQPGSISMEELAAAIRSGETAQGSADRLLIVDVRSSSDYLAGHIADALAAPLALFADGSDPYYTNGYDEVSTTAETGVANSWLAHLLINQLTNDFVSTYEDNPIVFYADSVADAKNAFEAAVKAGYSDVSFLGGTYDQWQSSYGTLVEQYCTGIEEVDAENGFIVMTGYVATENYENLSQRATHHCIVYQGGGLHLNGLLQADTPPFCFQELMTLVGARPQGNMADGIFYGDMETWQSKYPDGQKIEFSVTWDGAGKFYTIDELFEEKESEFMPDGTVFEPLGIEMRIGGTRDSNLNWNPGCIACLYACVCGITSNAKANELTWFADGGIYDVVNYPDDERNYYAGRYYPRADLLPGSGEAIRIKAAISN